MKRKKLIRIGALGLGGYLLYKAGSRTVMPPAQSRGIAKRIFDPAKVYKMIMLTDADYWQVRCNAIAAAGFDTVQMVVPIHTTFKGAGRYDFSEYVTKAQIAVNAGLNIALKPWAFFYDPIINLTGYFSKSDMINLGTMKDGGGYQLSHTSPKYTEVFNWAKGLANAMKPYKDLGYMLACFPATTNTQELGYSLGFGGDSKEGATATAQYSKTQARNIKKVVDGFCAAFEGWQIGCDFGGITYDGHKMYGCYDYETICSNPAVKFIKVNTGAYHEGGFEKFTVCIMNDLKTRRGIYSGWEITNEPPQAQNYNRGTSLEYLTDMNRWGIDNGCNLMSFAFYSPDKYGGGTAFETAKKVVKNLRDSGHWNKTVTIPRRQGLVSYSLDRIFTGGGMQPVLAEFNALATGGNFPNVRCTG